MSSDYHKLLGWSKPDYGLRFQSVLRVASRKQLSRYLNVKSDLVTDNGQCPDFTGLAELIGFDYLDIKNFERAQDPTAAVLDAWSSSYPMTATLGEICRLLAHLGRADCLTDCRVCFESDIKAYWLKRQSEQPLQESTVSQSELRINEHDVDETAVITTDDVTSGQPTIYDAFVCYSQKDFWFVLKMIEKLEAEPFSLKLCIVDRNVIPGSSMHTVNAKLIEDRCKRMVAVMSPNYLHSPECDFQTKFAHSISPGSRSKKLIPVIIEPCSIPKILRQITPCDYTRDEMHEWFWDRLASAIKAPFDYTMYESDKKSMSEIKLNLPSKRQISQEYTQTSSVSSGYASTTF